MSDSVSDCTERPRTAVTEAEVEALVQGICFKTGPPRTLGVEVEWLVHELRSPQLPVTPERLEAAYAALRTVPLRSALTVEPGGQLELSSPPATSLMECIGTVSADLDTARAVLREHDLDLVGIGNDPWHSPRRFLRQPRYDAMETCLDRAGPAGRAMMCTSASVQVCLDAGYEEPGPLGHGRRWWLAHQLGAVLVAAFANSPLAGREPTGWLSTRQLLWMEIGPDRAGAPPLNGDPRAAWARHVVDAPVMCVRQDGGAWDVPEGLSFREWTRSGAPRPPTQEDLDYHLTTLFPPVRPRGHLELRMIDAQPGEDGWIVPLAVTTALFDDPEAAETAYRAVKPLAERALSQPAPHNPLWLDAARSGLADPELREVADVCFAAALEALPRLGATTAVTDAVAAYRDRYVARGRCPADDLLDELYGTDRTLHGKDIRT
ncbi:MULTISPECIES: ergothioneine biosynthesis glutamate--cysteine ligase EgtA [Streptomyces]|uniref:Glutamate--cysteine ligase EgtA n=1 Tax=Streptomyces chartreusis TaxID=1969 RepID=A0A7H8T0A5_STRCX|nr:MULTISPECIES: ergothioneine biosynthesis glutamate--cysteine ligase EgtA [Streptomyces]MBT1090163.1 ergothioneine biosynthesis glutamate--cysteine ligase EgtA [Streptomyces sp. Tu102]QEV66005.1 ergothioneine biosynthesis glutamate--cysteine ligase EgtA [Streptomyces chartreusis]QKZ16933.1 ergothioneine biosynthesis glutamate--cysteine ligase EgtA [Streptomyces chartreusis]RSO07657.1 ergothioneine biosynthesis glutamate--cysteine ligase EgtA [Streptomyces sp. WAC 05379]GGW97257.1 glutamate--